ncbi:hypothetical protein DPMN_071796 [Dreissena polymorpha]|uniref:Retrotransposon gag domain-containing protein n=1 Tax=Dreissena polymorpha TaxID=45954 RepID=A0A9D3Z5C5_DREPO|nr:hypothetical protein DPMN_071796 [Dreissena polymorpha]
MDDDCDREIVFRTSGDTRYCEAETQLCSESVSFGNDCSELDIVSQASGDSDHPSSGETNCPSQCSKEKINRLTLIIKDLVKELQCMKENKQTKIKSQEYGENNLQLPGQHSLMEGRFNTVPVDAGMGRDSNLSAMAPPFYGRADGSYGQFVFTQLPQDVMHNYNLLIGELNSRFRVIETEKSFASKFAHRYQRQGESVEEYAANLRELYDRAHARRDKKTRDEDLVRRFLHGLRDEEARFEIEFHKDPSTHDEAVYYAVTFSEVRKSQDSERRSARRSVLSTGLN